MLLYHYCEQHTQDLKAEIVSSGEAVPSILKGALVVSAAVI
jgi:hypothetical protein